jgi:hypothetical protein
MQKWETKQQAIRMGEKPVEDNAEFNFKNDEENLRYIACFLLNALLIRQSLIRSFL